MFKFQVEEKKENKNNLNLKRTNDWNRNPVPCLTMYKRNITIMANIKLKKLLELINQQKMTFKLLIF